MLQVLLALTITMLFYWVHYLSIWKTWSVVSVLYILTNSHLCFQVKWAKENYHHNIGSPYSLRLASADATGKIIVWDVATGTARCEIQEHSKPIQGNDSAWCLYGTYFMEHCLQIHHLPFINCAWFWQGIFLLGLPALCMFACSFYE